QRILVRHRQPSAGTRRRLGPRAPAVRRRAPRRATVRDALDLRAIPAALQRLRHRQPAARLSTVDAPFQWRDRYWRALRDCRRIRGMTFLPFFRRGLAWGLAGGLLLATLAVHADAR